jgi:iron complex transport system substrate-binding protein
MRRSPIISPTGRWWQRPAVAALATSLALVVAACGDDGNGPIPQTGDPDTGESTATTGTTGGEGDEGAFPVDIEAANGTVTIEAAPERIVSLSPTATEVLYAIEAGDQVVAVDDQSNVPADAPVTDLSGYEPNVEAIAGYEPDLVIVNFDANDVIAGLNALDVPVIEQPSAPSLDEAYAQIEQLGAATGKTGPATGVVEQMRTDIEAIVAEVPERDAPVTYFHEIDAELFTATSATFIGELYGLAGLVNVADEADDGDGYVQVSAELVLSTDPDVIFLADATGSATAGGVAARPGWDQLTAVREGRVLELDPDIASRWGPRAVDFLRTIVEETADV